MATKASAALPRLEQAIDKLESPTPRMLRRSSQRMKLESMKASVQNIHGGDGGNKGSPPPPTLNASLKQVHAWGFGFTADNPYLLSGYRVNLSRWECFRSLFQLHNETINVWTHFLGAVFFMGCIVWLWNDGDGGSNTGELGLRHDHRLLPDTASMSASASASVSAALLAAAGAARRAAVAAMSSVERSVDGMADCIRESNVHGCVKRTAVGMSRTAAGVSADVSQQLGELSEQLQRQGLEVRAGLQALSGTIGDTIEGSVHSVKENWKDMKLQLREQYVDSVRDSVRSLTALSESIRKSARDALPAAARDSMDGAIKGAARTAGNAARAAGDAAKSASNAAVRLSSTAGDAAKSASDAAVRASAHLSRELARSLASLEFALEHARGALEQLPAADLLEKAMSEAAGVSSGDEAQHLVQGFPVARWPIYIFAVTAILCLSFSAIFHLFYVQSASAYLQLVRLDFAGISLLITGSFFPFLYYTFFCMQTALLCYFMAVIAFGILTFIVSFLEVFSTAKYFLFRVGTFVSFACFALVPLGHLMWHFGLNSTEFRIFFWDILSVGMTYIIGIVVYVFRIPERFGPPRKFDILGASHQVWHLFVFLAALLQFWRSIGWMKLRQSENTCPELNLSTNTTATAAHP